MHKTKFCEICGGEFKPKGREKACGDDCREFGKRQSRAKFNAKAKAMKNKHKPTNWSEITKKCKEAGLTYGQAVAKGVI